MTSIPRKLRPLSEDERFDLVRLAMAHERRNHPLRLLIVGAALLIVAAAAAGYGWYAKVGAERSLRTQTASSRSTGELISKYKALQSRTTQDDGTGPAAATGPVLTRIQRIAEAAGVTTNIGIPSEKPGLPGQIQRRDYAYRVSDRLGPLLRWVRDVVQQVPGMEVRSLTLTVSSRASEWTVDVTFSRWEHQ